MSFIHEYEDFKKERRIEHMAKIEVTVNVVEESLLPRHCDKTKFDNFAIENLTGTVHGASTMFQLQPVAD